MSDLSTEIPIYRLPDGREFITEQDAVDRPEILACVKRFPNYWRPSMTRMGWEGPLINQDEGQPA